MRTASQVLARCDGAVTARCCPGVATTGLDPRRGARLFSAVSGAVVLFLAASSVPSPLYVVYQGMWHFSAVVLTLVFAVYVLFLLLSLLVVGGLSDHVGRRPVLAGALAVQTVAVVVFLLAQNVTMLLIARAVQGAATGAAITAMAATLVDLAPARAGLANAVTPLIGLALGALGCGLLVEYAPAPTRLVYGVLLVGFAVIALVVAKLPETSARRPGAVSSLRPRLAVPPTLRADVIGIVPILMASWALGGLFLSLGPSVAAELFGLGSHVVGGLVVTLLCGVGAVAALALHAHDPHHLLAPAGLLLAAGTTIALAGLRTGSVGTTTAGVVVAGLGFGAASLAGFGTLARIATPEIRGELMAVAYTVAYLAFSLPAVAAGAVTTAVGLRPVAAAYGAVVVGLGLLAVVARAVVRTRERRRERARVARPAVPQASPTPEAVPCRDRP